MSRKHFKDNDLFISRIKAHPEVKFYVYNSEVYVNKEPNITGSYSRTYKNVPAGHISLYELNINRSGSDLAYPFVIKDGYLYDLRSNLTHMIYNRPDGAVDLSDEIIEGSYPLSASIYRTFLTGTSFTSNDSGHPTKTGNYHLFSLRNIGRKKYTTLSKRFNFNDELLSGSVNMVNIPSIFYGSTIKKGSIVLNYYFTGSLIGTATDENQNGELVSTFGVGSGSVIGLVYYDEGVLLFPPSSSHGTSFTSSYFNSPDLDAGNVINYTGTPGYEPSSWKYFCAGANDGITYDSNIASASFSIEFKGLTYKHTLTMFCTADKGEYNFSNNPTFLDLTSSYVGKSVSSSYGYEGMAVPIKNIVSSSYQGHSESFSKTTYMTKVGVYDENGILIMTAEMARPYKKEETKDLTFKLKYDLF